MENKHLDPKQLDIVDKRKETYEGLTIEMNLTDEGFAFVVVKNFTDDNDLKYMNVLKSITNHSDKRFKLLNRVCVEVSELKRIINLANKLGFNTFTPLVSQKKIKKGEKNDKK